MQIQMQGTVALIQWASKVRKGNSSRVTHVGGVHGEGTPWSLTTEEVIGYIKDGQYEFSLTKSDDDHFLAISTGSSGQEILICKADRLGENSLLDLPNGP